MLLTRTLTLLLVVFVGCCTPMLAQGKADTIIHLKEVVIVKGMPDEQQRTNPLSSTTVNRQRLLENQQGSLMKTLSQLPGLSTIDIGSGQSKPLIRGLGFNQVVVVENNIKHEAQQWGMDHGLEIDQYTVEQATVIKGPASLQYGSDAIGGVIDLKSGLMPQPYTQGGSIDLTGKSNNNLLGGSLWLYGRQQRLWGSLRVTLIDHGDDRVPTDSISIYSYKAALHDRRVRNTAGEAFNVQAVLGWVDRHYLGSLTLSNVHTKNGFFANAHGLEPRNVDTDLHDSSDRDILNPHQEVNHVKMLLSNTWLLGPHRLQADAGYQHNLRKEWSLYVSHGYMPALFPDSMTFDPLLERGFDKTVWSAHIKANFRLSQPSNLVTGLASEHQSNRIEGRGFLIPAFNQSTLGGYALINHNVTKQLILQAGLRYDISHLKTKAYSDWFPTPLSNDETMNPTEGAISWIYLQRAASLNRRFNNLSWSAGLAYNQLPWSLKVNVGKSFRMPIVKELAANGVNYHRFSYEVGDPSLSPEVAYQADVSLGVETERFHLTVSPFIQHFPNYIYLNPTSEHDHLYGNGNQVFYYTQAKVRRYGGELTARFLLSKYWNLGLSGDYIHSRQLSGSKKGYALPFSPPASLRPSVRWETDKWGLLHQPYAALSLEMVATQTNVVPPEEVTPGHSTLDLTLGTTLPLRRQPVLLSLQVQNLLNQVFFNHTSYYRLINLPEPGRNMVVSLRFPFQ